VCALVTFAVYLRKPVKATKLAMAGV
jgi:hypothetical protein